MNVFRKVTHAIAVAGGLAVGWAISDNGQKVISGIVSAYPKASFLVGLVGFLGVLYHSPKSPKPVN